jgi:hypothetical protein
MSRRNDDPLALISTIDDDSDVPDLDGSDEDEEEEMFEKPRAHKLAQATKGKSIDFNEKFQFLLVNKCLIICFLIENFSLG